MLLRQHSVWCLLPLAPKHKIPYYQQPTTAGHCQPYFGEELFPAPALSPDIFSHFSNPGCKDGGWGFPLLASANSLNSALCCCFRCSIKFLASKERVSAERNLQSALSWNVSTRLTLDCRPAQVRGELLRCHKVVWGALWQVQVHGHSIGTRPVSVSVHP